VGNRIVRDSLERLSFFTLNSPCFPAFGWVLIKISFKALIKDLLYQGAFRIFVAEKYFGFFKLLFSLFANAEVKFVSSFFYFLNSTGGVNMVLSCAIKQRRGRCFFLNRNSLNPLFLLLFGLIARYIRFYISSALTPYSLYHLIFIFLSQYGLYKREGAEIEFLSQKQLYKLWTSGNDFYSPGSSTRWALGVSKLWASAISKKSIKSFHFVELSVLYFHQVKEDFSRGFVFFIANSLQTVMKIIIA